MSYQQCLSIYGVTLQIPVAIKFFIYLYFLSIEVHCFDHKIHPYSCSLSWREETLEVHVIAEFVKADK